MPLQSDNFDLTAQEFCDALAENLCLMFHHFVMGVALPPVWIIKKGGLITQC